MRIYYSMTASSGVRPAAICLGGGYGSALHGG